MHYYQIEVTIYYQALTGTNLYYNAGHMQGSRKDGFHQPLYTIFQGSEVTKQITVAENISET